MPKETNSELRPLASPRPRKRPITDASRPITNASSNTERKTCRRVAPSVRRVASSRVRWAIVIESVLAMTKLPTNSATPANASRKSWMIVRKLLVSFVSCFACASPVRTSAFGGSNGRTSFMSWVWLYAGPRRDRDRIELALLVEDRLRDGEIEDCHRCAPERGHATEFRDARRCAGAARRRARSRRSLSPTL